MGKAGETAKRARRENRRAIKKKTKKGGDVKDGGARNGKIRIFGKIGTLRRKKRRLSTRTPAHESYRLWLLDLSPDQVHRLPLQGPSLKVVCNSLIKLIGRKTG